jgi:hypothetical protein
VISSEREGPLGKRMSDLLTETMDMLEDHSGWHNDVVALIRVLLTSLILKIGNSARQTFIGDALHHSWNSLFDIMVTPPFVIFHLFPLVLGLTLSLSCCPKGCVGRFRVFQWC